MTGNVDGDAAEPCEMSRRRASQKAANRRLFLVSRGILASTDRAVAANSPTSQ